MEQKETKASKRAMWSVYVFIERQVREGRSVARRRRLTDKPMIRRIPSELKTIIQKFLYLNVTRMYKKEGFLCVQVGVGKKKELHMHDMKSVAGIQIREYDKSGRVQ
jgi:hypothetical protein